MKKRFEIFTALFLTILMRSFLGLISIAQTQPQIKISTYLGGENSEFEYAIEVAAQGFIYNSWNY